MRGKTAFKPIIAFILIAASFLLLAAEFSLPFIPSFLKLDLSAFPVLFGAFFLSPVYAVLIAAVKALLHFLLFPSSGGFAGAASFLCEMALIFPVGIVYYIKKPKRPVFPAAFSGIACMTLTYLLCASLITAPYYQRLYGEGRFYFFCTQANGAISDMPMLFLFGMLPAALLNGIAAISLTWAFYDPMARSFNFLGDKFEKYIFNKIFIKTVG